MRTILTAVTLLTLVVPALAAARVYVHPKKDQSPPPPPPQQQQQQQQQQQPDGERKTQIRSENRVDGHVVLQGIQDGRAWSMGLVEATGL